MTNVNTDEALSYTAKNLNLKILTSVAEVGDHFGERVQHGIDRGVDGTAVSIGQQEIGDHGQDAHVRLLGNLEKRCLKG